MEPKLPTDLIELRLGELSARIKEGREREGLTLLELGERSGVAPSTIQKVENRQMTPSIAVILKIADGLRLEAGDLIAPRSASRLKAILQRSGQHAKIVSSKTLIFEKLSADIHGADLESWRVIIAKGGKMTPLVPQQLDEQIIFCERGRVELDFGGKAFQLAAGDSLHCLSQKLYRLTNIGKVEAAFIMSGRFPHSVHASLTEDSSN